MNDSSNNNRQQAHSELTREAADCVTWNLTPRQICDTELIINDAFLPLTGFLNRKDYENVLNRMRLADNQLWPVPVVLDIPRQFADTLQTGQVIALRDKESLPIALVTVEDLWEPDFKHEANAVYDTDDETHAGVYHLMHKTHPVYIAGRFRAVNSPRHSNYLKYRHTPQQLKQWFQKNKWKKVVAFQTRNPMHRAHMELLLVAQQGHSGILIHPVVGLSKPGDIDYYTRVRCYEHIVRRMEPNPVKLSLLPLAMRMGGPREAVWHGLIRKNYGCTHMIIGRDHAGPGKNPAGVPFYNQYAAMELFEKHREEIGITPITFQNMVYNRRMQTYMPEDQCPKEDLYSLSGTALREILKRGEEIPEWFTFPEISAELQEAYPPLPKRGMTIFFTGLSGSGKSTLANALMAKLQECDKRRVSLLDGDDVRQHLSKELTFTKKDRSLNVRRIGFVASLVTKSRGIAICAPIAPYEDDRKYNRNMISSVGSYIEIYVNTPLSVCQQRDPKGYYNKAHKTKMGFTGVDDPYEEPLNSEIFINTAEHPVAECIDIIINKLYESGHLEKPSA